MSKTKYLIFLTIAIIIFILGSNMFNLFKTIPKDGDAEVISRLKVVGSDVSKLHKVNFFLYFPSEENVRKAASEIKILYPGFVSDIHQSTNGQEWTLALKGDIVPILSIMHKIREDFERISTGLSGEYDGWGAEIVK